MSRFFADFLFLLAAWTLVIKYVFPVAYALNAGEPVLTHVMWISGGWRISGSAGR